ncbi:MAG: diguanylate cyclase [Vulcanimicrobiaceae bacterium]
MLTLVAFACLLLAAYAIVLRIRVRALVLKLDEMERRESSILEGVRVLTAASRDSSAAVLAALDQTLRVLDPTIDDVIVFAPDAEELACIYAAGIRSAHFAGVHVRRDRPDELPAAAACAGHRIELTRGRRAIIPTDRSALAIPMLDGRGLSAVVYAASARSDRFGDPDALVRIVAQTASPYALAREREADRASATYDGLTGLLTPRAFRNRLQEEVAIARLGSGVTLSLWFIDTDNFKHVNDTFGHGAGDVVLRRMARLLQEHALPEVDLAARNGGDEFCAVVRNVQKVAAIERAQRFCEAVRSCDFGVDATVTASIGVAAYPYDAADASELLETADAAMYHSKRAGRDRVSFAVCGNGFEVYR